MSGNNEKLEHLLLQFMDTPEAREFQNDLTAADNLFKAHPVQPVDESVHRAIRERMLSTFKHHRYWTAAKQYTAVAAVVAAVMLAGLFVLYSPNTVMGPVATGPAASSRTVQPQFWSDTLYAVVMETDPIEIELAELTETIRSVRTDAYESTDTLAIDLMDIEEIEEIESRTNESNFWKGLQI